MIAGGGDLRDRPADIAVGHIGKLAYRSDADRGAAERAPAIGLVSEPNLHRSFLPALGPAGAASRRRLRPVLAVREDANGIFQSQFNWIKSFRTLGEIGRSGNCQALSFRMGVERRAVDGRSSPARTAAPHVRSVDAPRRECSSIASSNSINCRASRPIWARCAFDSGASAISARAVRVKKNAAPIFSVAFALNEPRLFQTVDQFDGRLRLQQKLISQIVDRYLACRRQTTNGEDRLVLLRGEPGLAGRVGAERQKYSQ